MATIIIPTPLRKFTGNSSKVNIAGGSVGEVLQNLAVQFPDLKKHLFDTEEKVRPFINVFVGEDDIRNLQQQNTMVAESSTISIVPAIAGGSSSGKKDK